VISICSVQCRAFLLISVEVQIKEEELEEEEEEDVELGLRGGGCLIPEAELEDKANRLGP
jgi:hypothetical protein